MLLYSKIMVKTEGNGSRKCSFNGKTAEEIVANLNQVFAIRKINFVIDFTREFQNLKVAFIMICLLLIIHISNQDRQTQFSYALICATTRILLPY